MTATLARTRYNSIGLSRIHTYPQEKDTMDSIPFQIIALLCLILFNGALSMSEIAVVSARKVRLQQRAEAGNRGAQTALELARDPGNFLSTIQIGITLIGVLTGAFGGATIAEELEGFFNGLQIAWLAEHSETISVGLVVVAVTFLSLVLGELAPKQIGLSDPEAIAARVAPPFNRLARWTAPLVRLLSAATNLTLRVLRVRPSSEPEVTEEEIKLLIEQGTEGGIFEPAEEELVGQVFRLADRPVTAQMTPRPEIVWLDLEDPLAANLAKLTSASFSYYPVARGGIDHLLGVVQVKELLAQLALGKALDLEETIRQPLFLPESMSLLEALKRFQESHIHIAFIIDEFGGIQGLSTLTDILEAIAGDFPDADEADDPEIIAREDGTYLLDGMLDIAEFKDLFTLGPLPGEEEHYYQTLGGFVMSFLGSVPSAGDSFECQALRLEVMDMDGLRVDKVLVTPLSGPEA